MLLSGDVAAESIAAGFKTFRLFFPFFVVYLCLGVCLFQTPFVQIVCFSLFCLCDYQFVSVLLWLK